jgi:hypothetical protein
MKRFLKLLLRPFWRRTASLRRQISTKIDQRMTHLITITVQEHVLGATLPRFEVIFDSLKRIEGSLNEARSLSESVAADTNLVLDSVVREVARMQMQIEAMHEALDDARDQARLAIVGADELEQMRAG